MVEKFVPLCYDLNCELIERAVQRTGLLSKLFFMHTVREKAGALSTISAGAVLDAAEEARELTGQMLASPLEETVEGSDLEMGKTIIMPEGAYGVGVNIPAGSYILTGMEPDATAEWYHIDASGEERTDYYYFDCDGDQRKQCLINAREGDRLELEGRITIEKAEMFNFDE